MATVAKPLLITVDQYRELARREDVIQELHWGRIVNLSFPKIGHKKLQEHLVDLLRPRAEGKGVVFSEVPFRAVPEYDIRGADVAFVSRERWIAVGDDDDLYGSPELVIEVLSPSNTRAEMREKAGLCLSAGAEEFWVVHPKRRTVTVMHRDGRTLLYAMGQRIPLTMFGGELAVDEIFAAS
jgi:Uma2 family endonuclease